MTGELTPAYDRDTGQVVLEGLPTGAAGGAGLVPAAGLELIFDRADGRLSRVAVNTQAQGGSVERGEAVAARLIELFGPDAPEIVRAAAERGTVRTLSPDRARSAIWSRLARLDAARATSPVAPASALWAVQAAQLAERSGLHDRARAETHAAVAVRAQPGGPTASWLAVHASMPEHFGDVAGALTGAGQERIPGLQWSLDLRLTPERVLLPGLSPLSDLLVHPGAGQDRIVVTALRDPAATDGALSRCRARLVDPAARRVLDVAEFAADRSWARAEIRLPFPVAELRQAWIEVVDDAHRPVHSERLRRVRRALRWADAALRAEQRPEGLAPQWTAGNWAALASLAWERCSCDWQEAGDADRAYLAAARRGDPGSRPRMPQVPSRWAAELAGCSRLQEPAFLAERS